MMDPPKILEVPNVQQQFNWDCGPSCIETVASYFGESGTSAEFAELMGTDVNNGTDPSAMCHMLNQLGLNYEDRDDLQIQDLQHYIALGQPIIAAIQDYEETPTDIVTQRAGHWVVVIGADAENVYLQDPSAYETNGRVVMPALEFLARWQDYAGIIPDNDTQYVHYGIAVSGSLEGEMDMRKSIDKDRMGIGGQYIPVGEEWNGEFVPIDMLSYTDLLAVESSNKAWPEPGMDWSTATVEQQRDGRWAIVMNGYPYFTFPGEMIARGQLDMLTNHSGVAWQGVNQRGLALHRGLNDGLNWGHTPGGLYRAIENPKGEGYVVQNARTGDILPQVFNALWEAVNSAAEMEWGVTISGANQRGHAMSRKVIGQFTVEQDVNGRWYVVGENEDGRYNADGPFGSKEEAEQSRDAAMSVGGYPFTPRSFAMHDINDVALQFCGLLRIGKKATPEVMGMLRKSLKEDALVDAFPIQQNPADGLYYYFDAGDYIGQGYASEEEARNALYSTEKSLGCKASPPRPPKEKDQIRDLTEPHRQLEGYIWSLSDDGTFVGFFDEGSASYNVDDYGQSWEYV